MATVNPVALQTANQIERTGPGPDCDITTSDCFRAGSISTTQIVCPNGPKGKWPYLFNRPCELSYFCASVCRDASGCNGGSGKGNGVCPCIGGKPATSVEFTNKNTASETLDNEGDVGFTGPKLTSVPVNCTYDIAQFKDATDIANYKQAFLISGLDSEARASNQEFLSQIEEAMKANGGDNNNNNGGGGGGGGGPSQKTVIIILAIVAVLIILLVVFRRPQTTKTK